MLPFSSQAKPFNLLKFHCSRLETQGDQSFLSEIKFKKATSLQGKEIVGEVLSYTVIDGVKKFISGYSLYLVKYQENYITGLTGDPTTGNDGTFSLTKIGLPNNSTWDFSYANNSGDCIEANFICNR
jgi:hypothetical protein